MTKPLCLYLYLSRSEGAEYCLLEAEAVRRRALLLGGEHRPDEAVLTHDDYRWLTVEPSPSGRDATAHDDLVDIFAQEPPMKVSRRDLTDSSTIACSYDVAVTVRGIEGHAGALRDLGEFNRAWGFEDGSPTKYDVDAGEVVAKPDWPRDFAESQRLAMMSERLIVRVTVYKDGSRSYRLE